MLLIEDDVRLAREEASWSIPGDGTSTMRE
jgi:hypothetical protein